MLIGGYLLSTVRLTLSPIRRGRELPMTADFNPPQSP
jgi:hypothetical protein